MKSALSALLVGLLFGAGLVVAGMTDASKVIGFLDFFGNWDPSLAFVMMGAIAVTFVSYRWVLRREGPIFGERFGVPSRKDITLRLVAGSALFGLGWGLGGFCPGPGLVSAVSGGLEALVFVGTMSLGMLLWQAWERVERLLEERRKAEQPSVDISRVLELQAAPEPVNGE